MSTQNGVESQSQDFAAALREAVAALGELRAEIGDLSEEIVALRSEMQGARETRSGGSGPVAAVTHNYNANLYTGNGEKRYQIPEGTRPKKCRSCSATIYFVPTDSGRTMPVEGDGLPHWERCDDPDRFKKRGA